MPYPNEYAARIHDPDKYDKIRRENGKFGEGVDVIWGVLPGGKTEVQAIRFSTSRFKSPEQVKKWLKDHDYNAIEFEPPKGDSDPSNDGCGKKKKYGRDVCHDSNVEMAEMVHGEDGSIRGRARVTRTGVFVYRNPDGTLRRELRHPEDVFARDSLDSMKMIPITILHPTSNEGLVTPQTHRSLSVGFTGENVGVDGKFVDIPVTIPIQDGIDAVNNDGLQELSLGYTFERDDQPGTFDGENYDYRQRNIRYNHLALVKRGRAGAEVRLNMDDGTEVVNEIAVNYDENNVKPIKKEYRMPDVMINLDGLTYTVPAEVDHYIKNRQTALDCANNEVSTLKADVQKANGERDAARAELKVAQDAASPAVIAQAVKARVELETIALDVLDEETAKTISALSNRDLKVSVIKAKLPDLSIAADANDDYVNAIFDVAKVKKVEGEPGSAQRQAVNHDALSDQAVKDAGTARKSMMDRLAKAYQTK